MQNNESKFGPLNYLISFPLAKVTVRNIPIHLDVCPPLPASMVQSSLKWFGSANFTFFLVGFLERKMKEVLLAGDKEA